MTQSAAYNWWTIGGFFSLGLYYVFVRLVRLLLLFALGQAHMFYVFMWSVVTLL